MTSALKLEYPFFEFSKIAVRLSTRYDNAKGKCFVDILIIVYIWSEKNIEKKEVIKIINDMLWQKKVIKRDE